MDSVDRPLMSPHPSADRLRRR